ncbi:MAG TPA: serine/threonine-protein kinase, partial [Tepidisphaeraceae bacterium]|nr:serine/threonine-protein kinase [Tepidisphaeraceae bacterium]
MSVASHHSRVLTAADTDRDEQIQNILNQVRKQRAAGQAVSDDDVIAQHPHLMPELSAALVLLKRIQGSIQGVTGNEQTDRQRMGLGGRLAEIGESETTLPPIKGYRLLKQIQRGGQAIVFLAVQESTQRKVAIKVLDGGAFVTPRKYERFEREVKALVAIDHPGIVRIVDRGRTIDGSYFITMDYVEGEDLDTYLAQRGIEGWNVREVVELYAKVATAIGEAHRAGIVHRDVKPSNILIDIRGEPRILDFGLARLTSLYEDETAGMTITQTGGVVGSLPWASPEQASGDSQQICPASDVYSLGVAFYRALVGRSPYDLSGTIRMQMQNICEAVPEDPAKIKSAMPFGPIDRTLATVMLKCLEKNPAERYMDGGALALALGDYLDGRLQAAPVRSLRKRHIAAVAGIMMIAIAGTSILSPYFQA